LVLNVLSESRFLLMTITHGTWCAAARMIFSQASKGLY
jgi:hypothetical protein